MTADLVDVLGRLLTDFRNANRSEKAAAQPYPDPAWRPGQPSKKQRRKKARREISEARTGYQRIVALATPQYAETG